MKETVLYKILYDYSCLDEIIDGVNTTVDDEKNTFKLSSYGVELKVGESISFDKSSLTDTQKNNVLAYEVTNHEVISIDRDGNVTGLKAGSSNVKISTGDGKLLGEVAIKVVEN